MQKKDFDITQSKEALKPDKSGLPTQNPSYRISSNLLELLKAKRGQNLNIDISMLSNKGSLTNLIEKAKKYQKPFKSKLDPIPIEKSNENENKIIKSGNKNNNDNLNKKSLRSSKFEVLEKLNKIKIGNNRINNDNDKDIEPNIENSEDTNEITSSYQNYNNLNNESDLSQKNTYNNNNFPLSNETSSSGTLSKLEQLSNKEKSDNLSHEEDNIDSYSSTNKEKNNKTNYPQNKDFKKNFAIEYETIKENYFIESCNCVLEYSFRENQNIDSQPVMEDKSKSIENFNNNINQMLFELFDGHGGDDISNFLQQNFTPVYKNNLDAFDYDIPKSLTHTFKEVDELIKDSLSNLEGMGSTGTIVHLLWENDTTLVVYTGNVGDSRVSLISKNHIIRLSYDHRMSDEKEKERIMKSGLEIINERIGGELMLTRVFGDYEFKQDEKGKIKGVICEPFLSKIKIDLNIKNQFLILASDGIWDLISEKEIQQIIAGNVNINSDKLCTMIIKKALDKDSWDNMSVFAIKIT